MRCVQRGQFRIAGRGRDDRGHKTPQERLPLTMFSGHALLTRSPQMQAISRKRAGSATAEAASTAL